MNLPDKPMLILGVPYTVEFSDLPDPDERDCDWCINRDRGVFTVQNGTADTYVKRSIFNGILREAIQVLPPSQKRNWGQTVTFAHLYFGVLRSNPTLLSFCAGRTDDIPKVVNVGGVDWLVSLVDYCPGYDKNTFGLTIYREQNIYLRREVHLGYLRPVLLHEVGHAVAEISASALLNDEGFMRVFHTTLHDFLKHNPEWTEALFGEPPETKEGPV